MPDYEKQTIQAINAILPSVVSIIISKFVKETKIPVAPAFNPMGQFGVPLPEQSIDPSESDKPEHLQHRVKVGGGSGFVISEDGLILTNKHVVYDADADYVVITSDEQEHKAKVVSRDPINDVAILKIDTKGEHIPTAVLGDSDDVVLGQTVVAVGNALGVFNNTVSKGIISGLSRKVTATLGKDQTENLRHVMQTDVAINQGNSGGPLLNLDGEVIGINTAVIFGAQNIGFAIPINWAKVDLRDWQKYGRIVRPYLGMRYITLDKDIQQKYDLPVEHGALVMKDSAPGSVAVVKNSPADKAGIKEHDIVLYIDGKEVNEKNEIADILENYKVGDKLELDILRNDKRLKTFVTLTERK